MFLNCFFDLRLIILHITLIDQMNRKTRHQSLRNFFDEAQSPVFNGQMKYEQSYVELLNQSNPSSLNHETQTSQYQGQNIINLLRQGAKKRKKFKILKKSQTIIARKRTQSAKRKQYEKTKKWADEERLKFIKNYFFSAIKDHEKYFTELFVIQSQRKSDGFFSLIAQKFNYQRSRKDVKSFEQRLKRQYQRLILGQKVSKKCFFKFMLEQLQMAQNIDDQVEQILKAYQSKRILLTPLLQDSILPS